MTGPPRPLGSSGSDRTGAPGSAGLLAPPAHVSSLRAALAGFDAAVETAERWGRHLAVTLPGGARLLAAGNGGSAAEAQHLTAELVGRYRLERRAYSAIALHAETSSYTALSNDYGVEAAFARQVEAHGRPGDVLVLLSTSGTSPNLLCAAERARAGGLTTWALTGPLPNPLAGIVDDVLAVDSPYPPTVQELHLVAVHAVCAAFDVALRMPPAAPLPAAASPTARGRRPDHIDLTDRVVRA